ncbi:hypothetical protein [Amycolatopsis sp. NPDC051903]|uniref:hypothetical protein n=1 Tax=Amycolatopsis sp. NPDC051903 TaxID=3363936 RepID=UPI003794E106
MQVTEGYHGSGNVIAVESPVYLIEFWTRNAGESNEHWTVTEHELTRCTAAEALEWAARNNPVGGDAVVYACQRQPVGSPHSEVHVLLAGTDPSRQPSHSVSLDWSTP